MKTSWKVLIIVVSIIVSIFAIVRFVGSPIIKRIVINHSEEWIGRKVEIGGLSVSALTGNVRIKDLRLYDSGDTTTFVYWKDLDVNISLVRLIGKRIYLRHIHLSDFSVNIWTDGERFNFSDLPERFASDDDEQPSNSSSEWRISLNDIVLHKGKIAYTDRPRKQDWSMENMHLNIPGLEFGGEQTDAGLRFDLPDNQGSVTFKGSYNMQSNIYSLTADLNDIDLHLLLPMLQQTYSIGGLDGVLSAHLLAHGSLDDVMGVQVQGKVDMEGLEVRDVNKKTCAELAELELRIKNIVPKTNTINLESLQLSDLTLNITRDDEGNTISRLLETPQSSNKTDDEIVVEESAVSTSSNAPMNVTIGSFSLNNSSINYTDKTLSSKFAYKIHSISASADNLSLNGQNNHIMLNASLPDGGTMTFNYRGSLDYENKPARVVAMLRNVQLDDLSPWVEDLFGYPVKGGIMSMTSDNSLNAGIIDGQQKIEIVDFKLGKKNKSSDAEFKNLPLKTAVGLMTDMSGKILIEVPIEGDMNEPKFSLGKVIGRAIGNTLVKATAAPFVAIANAAGIQAGDLTQLAIDINQPDLTLDQYKKLDLIAQMMRENDNINLKMTQQFNLKSAIENQAIFNLKRTYYEQNNNALGELTLLDIEKINKISNVDSKFRSFAESLIGKKGNFTKRAVDYYSQPSLEQQVIGNADQRNRIIINYLVKQQNVNTKRITITTGSTDALSSFKGQSKYEVEAVLEDLE